MKALRGTIIVLAVLGTLTGLTALVWNTLAKTVAEAGSGSTAAILGLVSVPLLLLAVVIGIIFFYRQDRQK